ncbi:MAG: hypothetical protein ACP5N3_00460 [Candidatus Nanoarchaeia archaeon]
MEELTDVMKAIRAVPYSNVGRILDYEYNIEYEIEDLKNRGIGANCLDGALLIRKELLNRGIESTVHFARVKNVWTDNPKESLDSPHSLTIAKSDEKHRGKNIRSLMDLGFGMKYPLMVDRVSETPDGKYLLKKNGKEVNVYRLQGKSFNHIYQFTDSERTERGTFFNEDTKPMNSWEYISWYRSINRIKETKISILGFKADSPHDKIYRLSYVNETQPIIKGENGEEIKVYTFSQLGEFFGMNSIKLWQANLHVYHKLHIL